MASLNAVTEQKAVEVSELKRLRVRFHQAMVMHMKQIGFATTDQIIEQFKRWYLFTFWRVETSRAMSEKNLNEAIEHVHSVNIGEAVDGILHKYKNYASKKELIQCTQNQVNNIYAISLHSLKKSKKWMFNYIYSTLHRKGHKFNITFAEADTVIKRLEKYEAKILRDGK
jgi:hypothetical protein